MAESYYPNDAGSPEEGEREAGGKDAADMDKSGTCLVPRSMFQGQSIAPGDEFAFRVVHEYGDEIEVEYAKGDKKEMGEKPAESSDGPMAAFDGTFSGEGMGGE